MSNFFSIRNVAAAVVLAGPALAFAQTGGEAGIQGNITDTTGAAIPNATVAATNVATGVTTTRQTSGDGLYTISPILPGVYTVKITAAGFSEFTQNNLRADALTLTPFSVAMKAGAAGSEVTVNEAPPQLETSNATLGRTMEAFGKRFPASSAKTHGIETDAEGNYRMRAVVEDTKRKQKKNKKAPPSNAPPVNRKNLKLKPVRRSTE